MWWHDDLPDAHLASLVTLVLLTATEIGIGIGIGWFLFS